MKHTAVILATGLATLIPSLGCDNQREDKEPEARVQAAEPESAEPGSTDPNTRPEMVEGDKREPAATGETKEQVSEAKELAKDAAATLRQMKSDAKLKGLIEKSKGVFVVPSYGRGAATVGIRAGEGVLVAKQDGQWSDPAFYDIGGVSVGAQFGGEGGEIALILMSDQALAAFKQGNAFSLNADAKLTLVDYSGLAGASTLGEGKDIVFWSDTEGAFAGLALSVTDISWDDEENPAYYGKQVKLDDVLAGTVTGPKGELQTELKDL